MSVTTAPPDETTLAAPPEEDLPVPAHLQGAWSVLKEGLRVSPALRTGLGFTVVVSLAATVANLVTPILIQQIFDNGFDGGFRPAFVFGICGVALVLVGVTYLAGRAAARRLARASEEALMELRVRGFEHIHRLSIAAQSSERRGVYVARVTADVDTLSKFTEWGGIAWIVSFAMILGALVLMLVYSWQLTVPVVLMVGPLLLIVAKLQGSLSAAYDSVRVRVGEMLSEVSESVMGAAVVRAYGLEDRIDRRVKRAIRDRYDAQVLAHFRTAMLFPMGTIFWGVSLSVVIFTGATFGPDWGLTFGRVAAFLFLADVFVHTFTDLPEIYADTQTAISGWRKILALLELPVEIVEPSPGVELPPGPLGVRASDVSLPLRGRAARRVRRVARGRGAARTSRSSARPARARRRSASCSRAWPTRSRAPSRSRAWSCARSRAPLARPRSGWCRRTGSCSTSASARTSARAARAPPTARSRPRSRSSGSAAGSRAWRTGWRRASASAASRSRSASASSCRWRGRRSATPGC